MCPSCRCGAHILTTKMCAARSQNRIAERTCAVLAGSRAESDRRERSSKPSVRRSASKGHRLRFTLRSRWISLTLLPRSLIFSFNDESFSSIVACPTYRFTRSHTKPTAVTITTNMPPNNLTVCQFSDAAPLTGGTGPLE